MAYVLGTQPVVYISTNSSDTFTVDTAIKAPLLSGYSINKTPIVETTSSVKMSKTSTRVARQHIAGHTGVSLSFKTYMKPYRIDGTTVTAVEKFLLDSLSGAQSTNADPFIVNFNNTNNLPELYVYIVFDDDSYYKIDNAVVASATIGISIENLTTIEWELTGLDVNYIETSLIAGSYTDYTSYTTFIKNKLSTITIDSYNLAIVSGSIKITNTVVLKQRNTLTTFSKPTGHFVADRVIEAEIECYLTVGTNTSSDLYTAINNESNSNTFYDITLYIGGSTNTLRVELLMPTTKLTISSTPTDQVPSIRFGLLPQESTLGASNELQFRYNI